MSNIKNQILITHLSKVLNSLLGISLSQKNTIIKSLPTLSEELLRRAFVYFKYLEITQSKELNTLAEADPNFLYKLKRRINTYPQAEKLLEEKDASLEAEKMLLELDNI